MGDFSVYHYVLNEYHWTPKQWAAMSLREQALVVASIEVRRKTEEEEERKAKRKARSKHV
ncbi:hypothetical protein EFS61_00260 [Lactobacillus hominis]|nr:hypothetical protein [Lactobacillus hominis]